MNNFTYDIPTRVYFGKEQLEKLGAELQRFGSKVLLVYGGGSIKKTGLYDRIVKIVNDAGLELHECGGIEPNPRHSSVNRGAQICKDKDIDVVLAVGGGSVIDACKFICAGRYYDGNIWDFFADKTTPIVKA
ncbi:MAG: iron-containing alcohol dehydrogenase, partial [Erysipelotrichaceae bacterium]|nr:iron-containing alcohol dehydrogenase [Erysipelotrichaceae bacterium]